MKEKLSFKRKTLERAIEGLRRGVMLRRRMLPWEVTWYPTYKCNLRCSYCNIIRGKTVKSNPEAGVDQIIKMAPGSISILGGEPYIVKNMIGHLKQIRQALPNVFILVTTNGMIKEALLESLPVINGLCISMDGLGEYTSEQREGSDPEKILNNIKAVAAEKNRLGLNLDLAVNSVVTRHNARHLPEFYKIIADIDPSICSFTQAMQPFDDPRSIAQDPELTTWYLKECARLKNKIRLVIAGRLSDENLRKEEIKDLVEGDKTQHRLFDKEPHTCYQERFNGFIDPAGKQYSCRTFSALDKCQGNMTHVTSLNHLIRAVWIYAEYWKEFVLYNPSFECDYFRGCPEWMNDIILAKSKDELPLMIHRVKGRLSPKRVRDSAGFIREHINPDFKDEFLE
ncbi:radical SAM protein [bacterium]|nr:radical SAM protein [bacterium]